VTDGSDGLASGWQEGKIILAASQAAGETEKSLGRPRKQLARDTETILYT
jgi:hypothetical protein